MSQVDKNVDAEQDAPGQAGGLGTPGEIWAPTQKKRRKKTGPEEILLARGIINDDQLLAAREKQAEDARLNLLGALVMTGAISAEQALRTSAEHFKLPFERISADDVDEEVFEVLPLDYIRKKGVLPLYHKGDKIVVAISAPEDIFLIDDFRRKIDKPVELLVCPPEDIQSAIGELSAAPSQQVEEILGDLDVDEDSVEVIEEKDDVDENLEHQAGQNPVIRYVNYLITLAVREEASDIHIEPCQKRVRVRYRLDGILFEQSPPPRQMYAAIVSRIKIMANLDIAETRLPQDGKIRATVAGRKIDLRVSTLPTVYGEKCVLRILDKRSISLGMEQLGFPENTLERFVRQVHRPHGIVLVTGPTGSGKSTTLYSALQILDRDKFNIATVEDPVEYELDGINQVHVRERIGMTFAAALRSLLRQDPDVILLGEIRDLETATIAIQAALTGHMVFSTLHTNDAPSAITRLINIGVESFLISAAVNAVLAQRLIRRICGQCKEEAPEITKRAHALFERAGIPEDRRAAFKGTGCPACRNTGYKGRVGVYEFMELGDDMRDLITSTPELTDLRRFAFEKKGVASLMDDGMDKVRRGLSTIEEVLRITQS